MTIRINRQSLLNKNGFRIPDGLKKILEVPFFYNLMQNLSGYYRTTELIVNKMTALYSDHEVIDLGCGSGNITNLIPETQVYLGVDIHAPYVNQARSKHQSGNKNFIHGSILDLPKLVSHSTEPTLFFSLGVFHHLSDEEIEILISGIKKIRTNFVIVSLDPCFCDSQSKWSRFLANSDRGKFVRHENELASLLNRFSIKLVKKEISKDYIRTKMYIFIGEWN